MANIRYLRCSKCGCDATPRKWNPAKPEVLAEVGTSTTMLCPDCCIGKDGGIMGKDSTYGRHANMCRECCPTNHGTMMYAARSDNMPKQRSHGFTKYRLSNRIPTTAAEAERFLWHAQSHLANNREVCCSEHMTTETKQAMDVLYSRIRLVQLAQDVQSATGLLPIRH